MTFFISARMRNGKANILKVQMVLQIFTCKCDQPSFSKNPLQQSLLIKLSYT